MPQERKKTTEGGGSGAEHLVILAVDFFQEFRIGLESLPGTVATVALGEGGATHHPISFGILSTNLKTAALSV